jgi:hypothetical protein
MTTIPNTTMPPGLAELSEQLTDEDRKELLERMPGLVSISHLTYHFVPGRGLSGDADTLRSKWVEHTGETAGMQGSNYLLKFRDDSELFAPVTHLKGALTGTKPDLASFGCVFVNGGESRVYCTRAPATSATSATSKCPTHGSAPCFGPQNPCQSSTDVAPNASALNDSVPPVGDPPTSVGPSGWRRDATDLRPDAYYRTFDHYAPKYDLEGVFP